MKIRKERRGSKQKYISIRNAEHGQAMLELAFILPVIVILIGGVVALSTALGSIDLLKGEVLPQALFLAAKSKPEALQPFGLAACQSIHRRKNLCTAKHAAMHDRIAFLLQNRSYGIKNINVTTTAIPAAQQVRIDFNADLENGIMASVLTSIPVSITVYGPM